MDEGKSIDEGWDGPSESGLDASSVAARNKDWVVNTSGHDLAEMTTEQIASALRSGELTERVLVWRTGMKDWMALAEVPSLQIVLRRVARDEAAASGRSAEASAVAPTASGRITTPTTVVSAASATSASPGGTISVEPSSKGADGPTHAGNGGRIAATTPTAPTATPIVASASGAPRAPAPVRSLSPSPSRPRSSRPGSSSGRAGVATAARPASSSNVSAATASTRQPSSAGAAPVLKSVCVSVTNTPAPRRADLQTTVRVARNELPPELTEPIDHSAATLRVPRAAVAAARASAGSSNLDENVTLVKMPDGWRDSVAQLTKATADVQPSQAEGATAPQSSSEVARVESFDAPPSSRTVLVRDSHVASSAPGTLAPTASDTAVEAAPLVQRLAPLDSRRMLAARPVQRSRSTWLATLLACVASALVASGLTAVLLDAESSSPPTAVLSSPSAAARTPAEAASPAASAASARPASPVASPALTPVLPPPQVAAPAVRKAPAATTRVREPERAPLRRKPPRSAPRAELPRSDNPYVDPAPTAPTRAATAAFEPAPAGAVGREIPSAQPAPVTTSTPPR